MILWYSLDFLQKIRGLQKDTTITHKWILWWKINDWYYKKETIDSDRYFITIFKVKLSPPQAYFQIIRHEYYCYVVNKDTYVLQFYQVNAPLNVPFSPWKKHPTIFLQFSVPFSEFLTLNRFTPEQVILLVVSETRQNMPGFRK